MSNLNESINEVKLVFGGLDNAGKTSFIVALRQKYNYYETVQSLKPTIEIDYSSFRFLDRYNINIWDMGGQAKYRAMYENNPIYFDATDFLFYIIDIQDKDRFDNSLQYLKTLLGILETKEYSNEIIVCFHKFDPKYENNLLFKKARDNLKGSIIEQNPGKKFQFFDTSYYNIASLSYALSFGLNKLVNFDLVFNKLENLASNYNCSYLGIYDQTALIIADHYSDVMDEREFEENIKMKLKHDIVLIQKFKDEQMEFKENVAKLEDHVEYTQKLVIKAKDGTIILYFTAMAPELNIEEFKSDVTDLERILEKTLR